MPTPTYTPLANITLGSAAATVTFSSISGAYRDLILVIESQGTTTADARLTINGSSSAIYNYVRISGTGSSATSGSGANQTIGVISSQPFSTTSQAALLTLQFMDYSATDKHKTVLVRSNAASTGVEAIVQRWASTAAITSILVFPSTGSWAAGGTFSLYGIVA
jgi:hypothetical protein